MELNKTTQPIDLNPLRLLLARIEETYHPLQVWLFGSRARGDHRPDSDWDLFVIVPDDTPKEEIDLFAAWQLQLDSGVSADIIPCWLSAFQEDIETANTIPYAIAHEGVLLYER
jgi:predicted nucleotidyltransferase